MQQITGTLSEAIELGKAYEKIHEFGLVDAYHAWMGKLMADDSVQKVKVARGGALCEEPVNFNRLTIDWVAEQLKN